MNPIGNVFCSRCNTRLLSTEMQLPEEPKPVEETSVGVKGISLPTLPAAKEGVLEPEELPDWLVELTEQSPGKSAGLPDVAESAEQFPDWLSDIANEPEDVFTAESVPVAAAEETPVELPDWFSELAASVETPAVDEPKEPVAGAATDWFADLLEDGAPDLVGAEVPVVGSMVEVEEEPALEALPDWLSDVPSEEPEAAPAVVEPEEATVYWFTDLLEDEAPDLAGAEVPVVGGMAEVEEEPALEALPDWLSDVPSEEPAAALEVDTFAVEPSPSMWEVPAPTATVGREPDSAIPMRAGIPDWLLATAVPTPSGEVPISRPVPDWLLKNAEEPTPDREAGEQVIPAWLLQSAEPGAPVAEAEPFPLLVEEPEEEPAPEADTLGADASDWRADLYPEEELGPQAMISAAESEEEPVEVTPDWLLGIYAEEEVEPQATMPAAGASEVVTPDWLLGLYDEEEIEPGAAAPAIESEEVTASGVGVSEAGVPDWLAGIYSEEEAEPASSTLAKELEGEEAAPGAGVPDWLAGIMAEGPVPAQPQVPSEEEVAASAADIPDWLAGLATEAPSAEQEPPDPFAADRPVFTEVASEEPSLTMSATPDWLKGMAPVDEDLLKPVQPPFVAGEAAPEASEEEYEEPVLEEGEVPDWLKGLSPIGPSPVEGEAAFIERVSEDESLVRAEVPSWLQGLRPPGTGPLPPLPEVMTPGAEVPLPQEGGLVRAEIPDWVQQLRPAPSAEGEAGETRVLEPAETEGPLAGLRGVLPAEALADMPVDFEPVPPPGIPDSIVAQAQLWQRLLEQPRSIQRPVAQHHVRSGRGQMAMRWIVAVVLLAVTALGLLWSNAPLSQALNYRHMEAFSRAIDALEDEDTVIVAVEYGPAEAGEMTTLAQAVVQHLADQNAQVMMVSTLPEGAGLIHDLLAPRALANRLPVGQNTYLSGSSSGVAQFLAEPTDAKMIIVLAGRAERLRWWVEQNNAQATASAPALPMNVAVNAAAAPLALPYLETSPVVGWIAGFSDAVAYQEFRGLTSDLNSELNALMLTHWAALALLLFGLFYYLALGKKGAS